MNRNQYELYHHGVKGMKWGVRRTPEELGHKPKKERVFNERSLSKEADDYDKLIKIQKSGITLDKNTKVQRVTHSPNETVDQHRKYVSVTDRDNRLYAYDFGAMEYLDEYELTKKKPKSLEVARLWRSCYLLEDILIPNLKIY